jgi:hypothetical protein
MDEQKEIAARIEDADHLLMAVRKQLVAARRVKQSLLQNLLTGKIRLNA